MAPVDAPKANEASAVAVGHETLHAALADREPAELEEMGRRLAKSRSGLEEMLQELEAEQTQLREENKYLNETISLMMKEMHKLNIGAFNTVEPRLEEGPLDFVGRYWEKVKPRDSAVHISEHVGEIKKPVPGQEKVIIDPQMLQEKVQEKTKQVAQRVSDALGPHFERLGPLWQRAEARLKEAQTEWASRLAERAQPNQDATEAPHAANDVEQQPPAAVAVEAKSEEVSVVAAPVPAPAAEAVAEPSGPLAANTAAAVAEAEEAAKLVAEESVAAQEPEQIASTILIEAQLKIDDGSTQVLHVRAADRCKEVSHRFVQDHSLKAWFEEPLTAWLKKVEADAVKFPVTVEGDLMEIRKQHSKNR